MKKIIIISTLILIFNFNSFSFGDINSLTGSEFITGVAVAEVEVNCNRSNTIDVVKNIYAQNQNFILTIKKDSVSTDFNSSDINGIYNFINTLSTGNYTFLFNFNNSESFSINIKI